MSFNVDHSSTLPEKNIKSREAKKKNYIYHAPTVSSLTPFRTLIRLDFYCFYCKNDHTLLSSRLSPKTRLYLCTAYSSINLPRLLPLLLLDLHFSVIGHQIYKLK